VSPALSVEGLLGPGGALSAALDRYEHRPEQLKMAREVERALAERCYLLSEAGTGTGKTLAYLVPAVLSGRKVVISTATKTLQEQIFFKDIPLLRERVGLPFDAAYLKGRANYLCLHRFEAFDREPRWATREEAGYWPALREWALRTATGDRAELELPDGFLSWGALSTTSDTCLGQRCPLYEACHVTRARRRAEEADVLVVNHHLFFADLALRSAGHRGAEGVLPRYEAVIFDEAHALEDAATEYFGSQVSSFRLEELCADTLKALPPEDTRSGMLGALALKLRGSSESLFRAAPRALGLTGLEGSVRLTSESFAPLRGQVAEVLEDLSALGAATLGAEEPEVLALGRRSAELCDELDFIHRAESSDHVYWAEGRGRGLLLRAAPIDIAREMRKRLYSAVDTVVFTSATLTAEGRFDFFARRMGLTAEEEPVAAVRTVAVASPFDFRSQAALYAPTHLPEPNAPGFVEAVAEELVALAHLTGGRAFALFTSLRNMEAAWQLCRGRLPYQVLLQGERPKSALLEAFKREPSVLFAAHSFWEGVDVPGQALSLVMIDRLPFASPGDPLVAARIQQLRDRGEEPFSSYQLPEAAIALRQGFGRLIRTREDRGIVAIFDRRLMTKGYGGTFLRSLPAARRFAELPALEAWFKRG
jgi:ATP-dependent DNA helicase DinG